MNYKINQTNKNIIVQVNTINTTLGTKLTKSASSQGLGVDTYKLGISPSDKFSEVWSTNFKGDATAAYYADLAEKYTVDPNIELPIGTVMEISTGEYDSELCNTEVSDCVIGIVSEKPGFIMNEGLKNSAIIGLTGTLPARVIGRVYKKDILVSAGNGCLRTAANDYEKTFKVAVSLETNKSTEEKLIKCFAK